MAKFRLSDKTEKEMNEKNFSIIALGNDFNRWFNLVNYNNIVSTRTATVYIHKSENKEEWIARNPEYKLTGEINDFGNEKAVCEVPEFEQWQVYNEKDVIKILKMF